MSKKKPPKRIRILFSPFGLVSIYEDRGEDGLVAIPHDFQQYPLTGAEYELVEPRKAKS